MNLRTYAKPNRLHLKRVSFYRFFSALVVLAMALGPLNTLAVSAAPIAAAPAAAAATNTLQLHVFDATAPATTIENYQFLINEDNTGDPHDADADCRPSDPGLTDSTLANCEWPSIHKMPGNAPIVTQGTEIDFPLDLGVYLSAHPDPDPTKFLISVVADGYKIGGQHFSLPLDDANNNNTVEVELEPNPLPTLTFRAMVFNDNTSPNGAIDTPGEDGLNGFEGHVADVLGEISTDWFGNPLCTEYERDGGGNVILDVNGDPTPIPGTGGICLSGDQDHDGVLSAAENDPDQNPDYGQVVIPNLGSNRFAATVVPPNGSDWVQTTTLEGGHDWDTWIMEGATGYDTEFLYQNELFPWAFFGFVKPTFRQLNPTTTSLPLSAGIHPGEVKGTAWGVKIYVPPQGGLNINHFGIMGAKKDYPVDRPYIALADLGQGDQMVYMGRGNPDGTFDIKNVPPGDYFVTVWDGPQNLILDGVQIPITVGSGVTYVGSTWPADNPNDPPVPGNVALAGWSTRFEGSVFIDTNENGKRDPGEKGLPQQAVALKMRGNSLMQHGTQIVATDANGYYVLRQAYPINVWVVMEVYSDIYMTTGITYQADNQLTETTVLGQGVDVNVLPVIGLSGRLDWGVRPYNRTENGGIVGSVSYDVTRNELDPRLAAAEDWQPGIPGLNVHLYPAVKCTDPTTQTCDPSKKYRVEADGSFMKGAEDINSPYLSESWERPTGCIARDVDGLPVVQQALPTDPNAECVEAPMSGVQFGPMNDPAHPEDGFGATVDGNFGFGDIPAGDYLVEVEIPNDAFGKPLYKVTREEDINVFNGDAYTPQVPPPPCAGPTHVVDVAGVLPDAPGATINPNFADAGGSPYEGEVKPLCNMKLVKLQNGRSIAPGFNLFTDVPLPARFMGLTVDNLNLSTNPKSVMFGEVAGIPFLPVGVYDFNGRLLYTGESDPNGIWEILMPSSLQINCPTPSGVCPNMFNFVGNDPGQPFHRNANWNPQYQTITVPFEAWPGVINPADLAPMPIAATVQNPGNEFSALATCVPDAGRPQLFAVSKPVVRFTDSGMARQITISGDAFGSAPGQVTLDGVTLSVVGPWTNGAITVAVPAPSTGLPAGPHQLMVTASNGQSTVNSVTIHLLSGNGSSGSQNPYNPTVIEVGPGRTFDPVTSLLTDPITGLPYEHALQNALNAAANTNSNKLVVVYPNTATPNSNPAGEYFENIVIHSPVKLQGVGPGGFRADGTLVPGSILDGIGYSPDATPSTDWYALVNSLTIPNGANPNISDGEVVYVLPTGTNQFGSNYRAAIDGFSIQGGDQLGFPANVNELGGGQVGGGRPTFQGDVPTQGGGIYVHGYAHYLQITNNIVQSNGGAYGAGIRVGTPTIANNNDNLRIAYNRFLANGGTNLAGAIGLFQGSNGYEVDHNDLCGNFSAEYGGAISHFGLSPNGRIHDNRIYWNQSVDEGAGIMVAGELPANPTANYGTADGPQGAGAVDIYNNLIQSNIASDDGGGLRFLMAASDCGSPGFQPCAINVYNNMIVNNISAHEGGGAALDDAPNVRFYNNTVMKNLSTATAVTAAFGTPYVAGLSTGDNSDQLQATLPGGIANCGIGANAPCFSNPLLFNNIFWDNRAGSYNETTAQVEGIGLAGDATPIRYWDMGDTTGTLQLSPTNSILYGQGDLSNIVADASNKIGASFDPLVNSMYDTSVSVYPWRSPNQPAPVIISVDQPGILPGDYHLASGSPAIDMGAGNKNGVNAPAFDIDNQARPAGALCLPDSGADEVQSGGVCANLSITKVTDNVTTVVAGGPVNYTIVVSNSGPSPVTGAIVTDTFPAVLTVSTWTCTATAGSSCTATGSGNNRGGTVNLAVGGSATYKGSATLSLTATGTLSNTATVAAPGGVIDPNLANNSATDTDTIIVPNKHIGDLDRASFGGGIWIATVTIRVDNALHSPVNGATVTGTWSGGGTGGTSCTTVVGGTCIVIRIGIPSAQTSNTFTVTNVTGAVAAGPYTPANNHDPDTGAQASNGTFIVVPK